MGQPNIRQIEAFRSLMVTGSTTVSARMMGITQPAVSRLLRDLQEGLGLKLLQKRGTRLVPTAEGTALYAEVERSFIGLDRIRQAADEIRTRRTGALRIAVLPALANGFLPRFAGRFMAERPELDLSLHGVISPLVVDWVTSRQCDFGFSELPIAHPDLPIIAMPKLARVAVMPKGHRLSSKSVVRPEDMAGENFISLKLGSQSRYAIDQVFSSRNISRVMRVETHLSEIMCGIVSSGYGVAICDPFTASEFASRGVVTKPFVPEIPFDFGVLLPPGETLDGIGQDFVNEFSTLVVQTFDKASTKPRV